MLTIVASGICGLVGVVIGYFLNKTGLAVVEAKVQAIATDVKQHITAEVAKLKGQG